MIDLAAALATPIAKLFLKSWLGDTSADIGSNLFDIAKKRFEDRAEALEAQKKAKTLGAAVAEDLGRFFAHERAYGDDLEAAAHELGATIDRHVSAEFLVRQRLDADAIERGLLDARPVDEIYEPAEPANGYYRRLVASLAPRLRAFAPDLPDYGRERDAEILDRLGKLVEDAPMILAGIAELVGAQRRKDARTQSHEEDYRKALRAEVSRLRLFGIDLDPATPEQWPLSIAYIPLRLTLGEGGDDGGTLDVDYQTALALLPVLDNRLLIEGVAGSGKTTLLQWTALQALDHDASTASGRDRLVDLFRSLRDRAASSGDESKDLSRLTERLSRLLGVDLPEQLSGRGRPSARAMPRGQDRIDEQWLRRTPFLVRLRDCLEGHLPAPEALPALISREIGNPSEDWVYAQLKGGHAMLLLDGIDEVPDTEREEIRGSIGRYLATYPDTFFIVTSRPEALGPGWRALFGPWRAKVRPMAAIDRERLIEHWHEAVGVELKSRGKAASPAELDRRARELNDRIEASASLSQLAETPLLCSAICFLSRARRGDIPGRAVRLYETLCEMLISRRDRDRFREQLEGRFSEAYRALDEVEKLDLLARIAHFMISEGKAAIADDALARVVEDTVQRLPKKPTVSSLAILKALKERSGVLRGASETATEFAHNGFRSYLAARRFAQLGAERDLIDRAEQTSDPDLPVLAVAIGGGDYGEGVILELQREIEQLRPKAPRRLRIMALRCWQASGASPELQKEFLRPLEKGILPPRTFAEAGQLAELGERIVSRLRRRHPMEPGTAASSVRALRLIGGAEAGAALNGYRNHKGDQVIDELAQALNPLSIKKIATFAASAKPWEDCPPLRHLREPDLDLLPAESETLILKRAGLRKLDALRRFNNLTSLSLAEMQVADVAPLATLSALQELNLSGTQVSSVEPLKGLSALQVLDLSGTPVSSVEPLKGLSALQVLHLSGTPVSSVEPLRDLSALQVLDLSGTPVSSVEPLKGLSALQELHLSGTPVSSVEPLKGLTALHTLVLSGTPVSSVEPLKGLASLQMLVLSDTPVSSVEPLKGLSALQWLHLSGTQVSSIDALEGLTTLQWLSLFGTQVGSVDALKGCTALLQLDLSFTRVRSLESLKGLSALQRLDLSGTQVQQSDPIVEELRRRGVSVSL